MKLSVSVDTPNLGDARVIAEGVFRLLQCAAEGTPVVVEVNGRPVRVTAAVEVWGDRLPRRRAWQIQETPEVDEPEPVRPGPREAPNVIRFPGSEATA